MPATNAERRSPSRLEIAHGLELGELRLAPLAILERGEIERLDGALAVGTLHPAVEAGPVFSPSSFFSSMRVINSGGSNMSRDSSSGQP